MILKAWLSVVEGSSVMTSKTKEDEKKKNKNVKEPEDVIEEG